MNSTSKALTSRLIFEKLAYKLDLVDEKSTSEYSEDIILAIQRATRIENEPTASIIRIGVEHADAKMAAKMANAIAEIYIKIDEDKKSEQVRNIRTSIEEQLAKAKQRLTEAENNLDAFKEQEGEQVSGIALVMENYISTLKKQKMELLEIYPYEYPDVVKINEQIGDLRKELQSLPQNGIKFARLTREYEVNEKSYRLLQGKSEDAVIAEKKKTQDIKIVKLATAPEIPIKPNKKLAVIIGLIAGIILGVFIAITAEAFKL